LDEPREVVPLPGAPGALEQQRDQDVLARAERIGIDAEQTEQTRGGVQDALAERIVVGDENGRRRSERTQQSERPARRRARRVDRAIRRGGEACDAECNLVPCGKPTNSTGELPKASDALFTLKVAVNSATCALSVCDVNSSGGVTATDALITLKKAVSSPVTLNCPPGGGGGGV
jgi:hypothetical protein